MKHSALSFLEHGLAHLDDIAGDGLLCAFDFDGTLAPIVAQPDHARTPLPVLQRITELANLAPVAVITGRSVADIRDRLGFVPDFLIGNHGAEGAPGLGLRAARHAALCSKWKSALGGRLCDDSLFDPNIWIEDKTYSLSVHYRLARDQHAAEEHLQRALATLTPPPRLVSGKCVFNVVPSDAIDKGRALEALMQASSARYALYIGDDVTDEDVFRLPRGDILSLRIGRNADSLARFFLPNRVDLVQVLDHLLRRMRQAGTVNWVARAAHEPARQQAVRRDDA